MELLSNTDCWLSNSAEVTAMTTMELALFPHGNISMKLPLTSLKKRKRISGFVLKNEPSRKRVRISSYKAVRFADESSNSAIPRSVSQEDLPTAWYSRADYKSFREDSYALTLAFELGILDRIQPEEFCLRGLEASLSRPHLEARIIARATMTEVLLSAQQAQRGRRIRDPETLRGLSLLLSKDASEDAIKLAAYDRAEAELVVEEGESQSQQR